MAPKQPWVLTRSFFCSCSYTFAAQLVRGDIQLDVFFTFWFKVIRVLFCVFQILTVKKNWWRGRQRVRRYHNGLMDTHHTHHKLTHIHRHTTHSHTDTPHTLTHTHSWRPSWTCPWDLFLSLMKLFLVKNTTSSPVTTILQCQIIRISRLAGTGLKEWCSTKFMSFL